MSVTVKDRRLKELEFSEGTLDRLKRLIWKNDTIIGWTFLGLLAVLGISFIAKMVSDPTIWSTDPKSSDEDKNYRQAQRGMMASIVVSITFGFVNWAVDNFGNVNAGTSTAFFGAFLGGTIGYLADIFLGSEVGFRTMKEEGFGSALNYTMGNLATGKFVRYTVTLLLDMLISQLIFHHAYGAMLGLPFFHERSPIANASVSAAIAMITFQAYANQTRFLWAYPDPNTDPDSWIPGPVVLLALAVTAVMFLNTTIMDVSVVNGQVIKVPTTSGIGTMGFKLPLVIVIFMIMTGMFYAGITSAEPAYIDSESVDAETKRVMTLRKTNVNLNTVDDIEERVFMGNVIFAIIVFACSFITMISVGGNGSGNKWSTSKHLMVEGSVAALFAIALTVMGQL